MIKAQVGGSTAVYPPIVKTMQPKSVTQTSAMLMGRVNPNGALTSCWFEFIGENYGGQKVDYGKGETLMEPARLIGLSCGTTYMYKASAVNGGGPASGELVEFTTLPCQEIIDKNEYSNKPAASRSPADDVSIGMPGDDTETGIPGGRITGPTVSIGPWLSSQTDYENMMVLNPVKRSGLSLSAIGMDWETGEGLILTPDGRYLKSYDDGARWILFTPITSTAGIIDTGMRYPIRSLNTTGNNNWIGLAADGEIFITDDGGMNWELLYFDIGPGLQALYVYGNNRIVYGVGTNYSGQGTIWGFDLEVGIQAQYYNGTAGINSVFIGIPGNIIYAAGENEFIVKSGDGGESWEQMEILRISEGAGQVEFYRNGLGGILALLFLGGIVAYTRLKRSRKKYLKSIAPEVRKDPLGLSADNPTAEDTLKFGDTVDAVVQLINNPETKPPVNIVISGAWGSGKSSLMLQIQKKLKESEEYVDKEFVTAWFNIWHFQSEKHLLATFLSQILLSFEKKLGLKFRAGLFLNRLSNLQWKDRFLFWFALLMILPLLIFLILQIRIPYFDFGKDLGMNNFLYLNDLFVALMVGIREMEDLSVEGEGVNILIGTGGTLLWLFSFFFMRNKILKSGLVTLFELAPMEKLRSEVAKGDQGYREKYKKEFTEIMKTGEQQKKSLVVFIDDLDRVSGDQIKALLESINFISDTASASEDGGKRNSSIYFIIGMATNEVIRNLNLELEKGRKAGKDVKSDKTSETVPDGNKNNKEEMEDTEMSIGAKYLEKMIDLIVQVPSVESDTIKNLTARR